MSLAYVPGARIVLGATGDQEIMRLVVDPTVGAGVAAPIATFGIRSNGALYTKTGAAATAWTLVGSGGGGAINELWGPRITPHAADDEFDQNAVDASWSQTGFGGALNFGARPTPYVTPADNRASWENLRDPDNTTDPSQNSWMRIQPGAGPAGLWKRIDSAAFGGAVPADLLVWARFRFSWWNAQAIGAADSDIGMSLFQDTGAGFSFATHATINLNNTQEGVVTPAIKPLFWARDGGVITTLSEGTQQNNTVTNRADYAFYSGYVALQKIGVNIVRAWLIDDGGNLFMGTFNSAAVANINAIALWCRGNGSAMGIPIFDIDFIRFYQGIWLP